MEISKKKKEIHKNQSTIDELKAIVTITDSTYRYLSSNTHLIDKLIEYSKFFQSINTSGHKIELFESYESDYVIVKYMIKTDDRKNRLKSQRKLVKEFTNTYPDEEFRDFNVQVYFEG